MGKVLLSATVEEKMSEGKRLRSFHVAGIRVAMTEKEKKTVSLFSRSVPTHAKILFRRVLLKRRSFL